MDYRGIVRRKMENTSDLGMFDGGMVGSFCDCARRVASVALIEAAPSNAWRRDGTGIFPSDCGCCVFAKTSVP